MPNGESKISKSEAEAKNPIGVVDFCDHPEKMSRGSLRFASWDLFDGLPNSEHWRTGVHHGFHALDSIGKAIWVAFILVAISGIGLLFFYSPTVYGAFRSVEKIQESVAFGWWLRGVHKYATDLLIILAAIRLVRIAFRRSYKFPGEFTWISAVAMLVIFMFAGLTGYLLVWNQRIFWTGGLISGWADSYEDIFPLGGLGLRKPLASLIMNGDTMSQHSLSALFSWHIALGFIVLIVALFWITLPRYVVPKWRDFNFKISQSMMWIIFAGLTLLALLLPPPLGGPSDKILHISPLLADWYFLALYQLVDTMNEHSVMILSVLGLLLALCLPWIDRVRRPGPRPFMTAVITAYILTWAILTKNEALWNIDGKAILIFCFSIWVVCIAAGIISELKPRRRKSVSGTRDSEGVADL